ncbi:hypothetical protein Clacol_008153 [Clathrus columnatus]|uniref:E3 SUMO-protein ligase PIAS1 n=1 Tax=Clathrus columnatus TaxID=1419009 RepID=A0AAV5ANA1_9AGAM|nr:hypothetical protein Clacol_008153 [Clathrus columnatus]
MNTSGPWEGFENEKNRLRFNTVAKLQTIITGWGEQCRALLTKSGRKQDLVDRMIRQLDQWKEQNNIDKWLKAKAVLDQVRETGHDVIPSQSLASTSKLPGNIVFPSHSSVSPQVRYDPHNLDRKSTSTTGTPVAPTKQNIRFKSSPFFRVEQIVSEVIECPESTSVSDRKAQTLTFMLTNEQLAKLQTPGSKHQLRLFCTSSSWHNPYNTGFRTELPCPIEFPPTCEVRVNGNQITSNLKGIKKKPGTAPPADLGNTVRLNSHLPNRVEIVYVNSQQPVQNKKYYIVVILVEVKTVEQLVENLKKGKYKTEADIRAKMVQDTVIDDDIIAGSQKMSLKCPLTCARVNIPCRSSQCPHAQCFDATSWFSMMEQITTWLCPVCDKTLNVDELIIDGHVLQLKCFAYVPKLTFLFLSYFDHILKASPDSVEDVIVEADGEWHTSDNKYASEGWRKSHPLPDVSTPSTSKSETPKTRESLPISSTQETKRSPPPQQVIDLSDSDDDQVKRELSPIGITKTLSSSSGSQNMRIPSTRASTTDVIDLTNDPDSSDTENHTPSRLNSLKRKEMDPPSESVSVWKKARIGTPQSQQSASSPTTRHALPTPVPVIPYNAYPSPVPNGVPILNARGSLGNTSQVAYGSPAGPNAWPTRLGLPPPSYETTYSTHIPNVSILPPPNRQPSAPPVPPSPGSSFPVQNNTNGAYRNYAPGTTPSLPPLPAPSYFGNPYRQSPTGR